MQLNPSQEKAVNLTGTNILTLASAGGGKTTVLVSRLLKRIIKDRVSLDELVAITFTNAAALNMQKRLEKKLREASAANPNDIFIKDQISKIADANISTIHSFFLNIIKEYYYVIGLEKMQTNNILDSGRKALFLNKAFDETIEKEENLYDINHQLTASFFSFDTLHDICLAVLNKAISFSDPYAWIESVKSYPISKLSELNPKIMATYMQDIKNHLIIAGGRLDKMIELNTKHNDNLLVLKKEIDEALVEDDYQFFLNKLNLILVKIPTLTVKKDDKDDISLVVQAEKYKKYRSDLLEVFKKIASKLDKPSTIIESHNNSIPLEKAIFDLSMKVYQKFMEIKKENHCIDFDDFEHYASEILKANNYEIANKLKNQYKEIMVDEFQDTNDAQYAIIKMIANNNLFLVGDVKQSIYRFRKAKPSIMKSLKDDPSFVKIHIQNNYRSNTNIVRFNNTLFEKIMNIYQKDVDESDIQITLENQAINNEPILFKVTEDKENLALLLANTIHDLVSKENKKFGDIAVLVRSHAHKKKIKEAFKNYNIPYFVSDTEGYFSSLSIDIIESYFKLLLDKRDNISLATILLSPLYNMSDEELATNKGNWWNINDNFKKDYYELKKLASLNKIDEILYYILDINDFYLEHLSKQEKDNVDNLLNNLDNFNTFTITDFISYIEDTSESQKENASTISEDADVVKVMTIHHSKGLEFDTVILYSDIANRQNGNGDIATIDDEFGLGISYITNDEGVTSTTIKKKAHIAKDNIEDILEFQRLLYVALTRTRKRLIIVDAFKEDDESKKDPLNLSLIYSRKGFTSYILSAMKDYDDMIIQREDTLEIKKPFPYIAPISGTIPHKEYSFNKSEDIAPSSLESYRSTLKLDGNKGSDYGTLVHEIFENIDFDADNSFEELKHKYPSIPDSAINSIITFINNPIISNAKKGEIYQELPFYLKNDDTLTHGYMDFVAIKDDEIILIDYKTDSGIKEKDFIDRYANQLNSYKKVLKEIYKKDVKAYIYSVKLSIFIEM